MQCNFESLFRSNRSLLIFPSLTAAGFGDLHLVAASQQKAQPGDVKPRAGPRLLAPFGTAPAAFPGRAVRALPARPREARSSNARGPRVRPFPRKKRCKANLVSITRVELIYAKEIF